MLRKSAVVFRLGRPRAPTKYLRQWEEGFPEEHRPFQGGQNHFQEFLLKTANADAQLKASKDGRSVAAADTINGLPGRLPHAEFADHKMTTQEKLAQEMEQLREMDGFERTRGYNEIQWLDIEKEKNDAKKAVQVAEMARLKQQGANPNSTQDGEDDALATTADAAGTEDDGAASAAASANIVGEEDFQNKYGFSMTKGSNLPVSTTYANVDMWAEMPKYHREMFFMYIVSRRRNCYAVMYDYEGKRIHPVYTAGNRGMKGGSRGLAAEGGADTAHQVTSAYLNDVIPVLHERDAARSLKRDTFELVVRVIGFYNGRGGGLRAIQDRSDVFQVRYLEDVTPYPLNGPKLPTRAKRMAGKI